MWRELKSILNLQSVCTMSQENFILTCSPRCRDGLGQAKHSSWRVARLYLLRRRHPKHSWGLAHCEEPACAETSAAKAPSTDMAVNLQSFNVSLGSLSLATNPTTLPQKTANLLGPLWWLTVCKFGMPWGQPLTNLVSVVEHLSNFALVAHSEGSLFHVVPLFSAFMFWGFA